MTTEELMEKTWQYYAGPYLHNHACDSLEEIARDFIDLKRNLGANYRLTGECIESFVSFVARRGAGNVSELSFPDLYAFLESRAHLSAITWNRELESVSIFFDHLVRLKKLRLNPCALLGKRAVPPRIPYIFSLDELRRIFSYQDPWHPYACRTKSALYYLLYACGLRVSEAAALQREDCDLPSETIFIRKAKFNKERLLPIHPRTVEVLSGYLREKEERFPHLRGSGPVFANEAAHAYDSNHLSSSFHQRLVKLGLHRPERRVGEIRYASPTTHSLRHAFAVHRLLKWYREGADFKEKAMLLSTYMGHSAPKYTQYYLTITALILKEAERRFADAFEFDLRPEP